MSERTLGRLHEGLSTLLRRLEHPPIWVRAAGFALGFAVIMLFIFAGASQINVARDFRIMMFLNPARYVPVLDEFMVLLTDFTTFPLVLVFILWLIANYTLRAWPRLQPHVAWVFYALGIGLGGYGISGAWWAGYELWIVPIVFGALYAAALIGCGRCLACWNLERRQRATRVVWAAIAAVMVCNFLAEDQIKRIVARPRPLNEAYAELNQGLRIVKDEVVRGGGSYVSGHASAVFAMLTPLFWAAFYSPPLRLGILAWASAHAYTRIYLAAHFPYCVLMGSLLGFLLGTLAYWAFVGTIRLAPTPGRAGNEA